MTTTQPNYNEAPALAASGTPDGNSPNGDIAAFFSEENSAEIPFGTAVKRGTAYNGALQPTAESDVIIGFVVRDHAYAEGELGATGVKPAAPLSVMRRGRMWVQCDSGCTAGDALWVRAVATTGQRLGAPEDADDSTDTVSAITQGTWRTTASAGEVALLEFDFVNI